VCTLDVDLYLEAMRRGAFDCISLPLEEREFARIVSRALLENPVRMAPIVA
jgi:FixJ family two-component response regulator